MTTGINERQILTKHIPCKCKFKFDGSKCHSIQRWNKDKCLCGKTFCVRKKIFGILLYVLVKMINIKEFILIIQ